MKSLTLQVLGGLGSRLRAVLAGIEFCEAKGCELRVHWPRLLPRHDYGFPVLLDELWTGPYEVTDQGPPRMPSKWQDGEHVFFRTCHPHTLADASGYPFAGSLARRMTDGRMPPERRMVPTPEVQAVIDHHTQTVLETPTIGVNIRAVRPGTDRVAPVEWYVERIRHIADMVPTVQVFASLDDVDVSERLHGEFPGLVTETRKAHANYAYDRDGIVCCAAELHLLAMCDWFIGAETSCFSQIVQWMRGETFYIDDDDGAVRTKVVRPLETRCEDRENLADDDVIRTVFGV